VINSSSVYAATDLRCDLRYMKKSRKNIENNTSGIISNLFDEYIFN
jgi:hypothetical protein